MMLRFLTLCLVTAQLMAGIYPASIDRRVIDQADLLSGSQEMNLEMALRHFEQATSNQVVVALLPSLAGENLEDVSIRIFEDWHLGKAGRDNGILLVVFRDERKLRIEVGYGLEGDLPDIEAARIIREEITPWFKQGQYYQGLVAGLNRIMADTAASYKGLLQTNRPPPRQPGSGGGSFSFLLPLLILLFFTRGRIGPLGGFMLGSMLGSSMRSSGRGFGGGGFGGFSGGGGFGGGGGGSGRW